MNIMIDLQENPTFPYPNDRFDIVTMVVSVDYLIKPLQVFREIGRVLRPEGTAYISFSNRYVSNARNAFVSCVFSCFPTKAVSIWLASNDMVSWRMTKNVHKSIL
jgi:SAM-dependent methyltransferase